MVRWWQAAVLLAVVGPANAADLSLQRIMLSSGGVGYFEYEATVDGNAALSLDVPLEHPLFRRFDRLAVENRSRGASLPAHPLAQRHCSSAQIASQTPSRCNLRKML